MAVAARGRRRHLRDTRWRRAVSGSWMLDDIWCHVVLNTAIDELSMVLMVVVMMTMMMMMMAMLLLLIPR